MKKRSWMDKLKPNYWALQTELKEKYGVKSHEIHRFEIDMGIYMTLYGTWMIALEIVLPEYTAVWLIIYIFLFVNLACLSNYRLKHRFYK